MKKLKRNFPPSPGTCSHTASHPAAILGSLDNASPKTDQILQAEELFSLTIGREVQCHSVL